MISLTRLLLARVDNELLEADSHALIQMLRIRQHVQGTEKRPAEVRSRVHVHMNIARGLVAIHKARGLL
jgi:hypothetical protein